MTEPNPTLGVPFVISQVTVTDPASGQEVNVTLSHDVISLSFQTRTPDGHLVPEDVIHDLIYLPKTCPAFNVCRASSEEIHHLLLLARCQDTPVNGYRFEELFPSKAVMAFRDDKGKTLPGVRFLSADDETEDYLQLTTYQPSEPNAVTSRHIVNDQKRYLLCTVIPKFAAWLATCLSDLCIHEYRIMASSHLEGKQFCEDLKTACEERDAGQET